jgi:hypothetical protein
LAGGLSFVIDNENLLVVRSIVRELGNSELYGLIFEGLEGDLNVSNVFERLRDSETFNFASERLIAFAASHFHQFSSSQLHDISLSTFNQILSHPSLQIQDENSLYDLLSQHFGPSPIERVSHIGRSTEPPDAIWPFVPRTVQAKAIV